MKISILDIAKQTDAFFMNTSPIHETMVRLAKAFADLEIPFAIAGGMAANAHGYRRTTEDVGILLTREGLQRFKDEWLGRGWVEKFEGSKGFKDTQNNVTVDVLLSGEFPGDGLPKPVSFPVPEAVHETDNDQGIPFISLEALIELKLASGMTALHRLQDLADVMNLIRRNKLPREFAEQLNPYVHEKFTEMWHAAQVEEDY